MIDANTRLYGLIGNPVSGSKSPWIHNHIFRTAGIPGAYLAFPVAPEDLKAAYEGLKALGAGGVNVTIPYKTDIIPLLDRLDPTAQRMGAVNVVHFENGEAVGYNTDGAGLLAVLKRHIPGLERCGVLVLGAGGAAKGICGALLEARVASLGLWNRTDAKAHQLAEELQRAEDFPGIRVVGPDSFNTFDLVINTTSVGMEPHPEGTPVEVALLKPGAWVCDIVYKPHQTRLLREAEAAGHPVIHGIEMLIEQALLGQKIWCGLSDAQLGMLREQLVAASGPSTDCGTRP